MAVARGRHARESRGHQKTRIQAVQEKQCGDKSNRELGQGGPEDRRTNLVGFKTVKSERLGDQNNRGKQAKSKKSQSNAKHNRVPLSEIRKIHQGVWAAEAANERGQQENHGAEEKAVEEAGAPPVETLPLVQSGKQQRESGAGVEESGKTRRRAGAFS
jgi:hypothetical protein